MPLLVGFSLLQPTGHPILSRWTPIAHSPIGLVHKYIFTLLAHICPDEQIRAQLFETVPVEEFRRAYIRAMERARFLLRVERHGWPSTYNH